MNLNLLHDCEIFENLRITFVWSSPESATAPSLGEQVSVLLLGRTQQPTEFRNVSVANGLNRLVRFIYSDDQPKKLSARGRSAQQQHVLLPGWRARIRHASESLWWCYWVKKEGSSWHIIVCVPKILNTAQDLCLRHFVQRCHKYFNIFFKSEIGTFYEEKALGSGH